MNLNQVTIPALDMAKSCEFYLTLGLRQIVSAEHYARFLCPDGGSTLSLLKADALASSPTTIYFEHRDLDQLHQELIARGIEFLQPPADQDYLWREAVLLDPSFNKIKLYWAGVNRIDPPWRVDIVKY